VARQDIIMGAQGRAKTTHLMGQEVKEKKRKEGNGFPPFKGMPLMT
jgi:hypothetical protein